MENNNRKKSSGDSVLEKKLLTNMVLIVIGLAAVFSPLMITGEIIPGIAFGFGFVLLGLGLVLMFVDLKFFDLLFGIEELKPLNKKKSFKNNEKGTAVIYAVCIMGIFVTIITWFPLAWAAYEIMDTMTTNFAFPTVALGTINLMAAVIAWTPAVIIVGLLLYAIIASYKTEYPSQPVYR